MCYNRVALVSRFLELGSLNGGERDTYITKLSPTKTR